MNDLLKEYLGSLGKDWDTTEGLKNHFILIILLSIVCSAPLHNHPVLLLSLTVGLLSVYYILWKLRRLLKFVMFNRINIVFCFYNATQSENIEKYLLNFESVFLDRLRSLEINRVKVYFLPSDRLIKSRQEAERLIKAGYSGQTLLVWGDLTETQNDIRCRNTNFTYEFSISKLFPKQNTELLKTWFIEETKNRIDSYNWNLNFKNRLEIDTYTDNIKDIAIYILARTLFSVGKIEDGLNLLTELHKDLSALPALEKHKRSSTISVINRLISQVHYELAILDNFKKRWTQMEHNLQQALKYEPEDYANNLSMAYLQEMYKNDENLAKKYLGVAERVHKHGQNAYLISKAYFELKHENFHTAISYYRMLRRSDLDTNPVLLAENLREVYEKQKTPQFIFAEGFVKSVWLPADNGRRRLKQFLYQADSDAEKYKVLRNEAEFILTDPEYKKVRIRQKKKR